jgi:hypothetical protein
MPNPINPQMMQTNDPQIFTRYEVTDHLRHTDLSRFAMNGKFAGQR